MVGELLMKFLALCYEPLLYYLAVTGTLTMVLAVALYLADPTLFGLVVVQPFRAAGVSAAHTLVPIVLALARNPKVI